jgi:peptidoglycan/xylan/chitin deacetylase (PgdA/CDA1 family)
MAELPDHIAARRAHSRDQRRRRRQIAVLAVVLVALLAAIVVVITSTGGSANHQPQAAANNTAGNKVHGNGPAAPKHQLTALEARGNANIRKLIPLGLPVYCGGTHGNALAFTFDDGPGPYTHYALKKLTQAHERATFFVVGKSIQAWPGWLRRELKVATLGDHTLTHPDLLGLSLAEVTTQLEQNKQLVQRDSGQSIDLFRPPYGAQNPAVNQIAKSLGLLDIMWSFDSQDSLGANWQGIIKNVEADMRPGAIILMHENRGQTIRALTTLLPVLHQRHLRSVSLPELFATDPPSVAQVRQGLNGCHPPPESAPPDAAS